MALSLRLPVRYLPVGSYEPPVIKPDTDVHVTQLPEQSGYGAALKVMVLDEQCRYTRIVLPWDIEAMVERDLIGPADGDWSASPAAEEAIQAWVQTGDRPRMRHLVEWLVARVVMVGSAEPQSFEDGKLLFGHELDEAPAAAQLPKKFSKKVPPPTEAWVFEPNAAKRVSNWIRERDIAEEEGGDEAYIDAREKLELTQKMRKEQRREAQLERAKLMMKSQNKFNKMKAATDKTRQRQEDSIETQRMNTISARMELEGRREKVAMERGSKQLTWTTAPNRSNRSRYMGVEHIPGPYMGAGPVSASMHVAASQREAEEARFWRAFPYCWDHHGRRHGVEKQEHLAEKSMVGSALNKLKSRSEMDPGFLRKIFNQYDVDKSGALDRGEFRQALASLGCKLMPKEFDALFNHFDPNKSGMIDYGELMWGCFNTEGLLKKWRNRTRGKSVAEIKQIFYNYLSFGDRLSPRQLQKVMAEHFHADLDSEQVRVLFEQIDTDGDGTLDINEFTAFMVQLSESGVEVLHGGGRKKKAIGAWSGGAGRWGKGKSNQGRGGRPRTAPSAGRRQKNQSQQPSSSTSVAFGATTANAAPGLAESVDRLLDRMLHTQDLIQARCRKLQAGGPGWAGGAGRDHASAVGTRIALYSDY